MAFNFGASPQATQRGGSARARVATSLVSPTMPPGVQVPGDAPPQVDPGRGTTNQGTDERTGQAEQQSSNQEPAVTQANQMAQAPFFQPQAPGTSVAQAPWQQTAISNASSLANQMATSAPLSPMVIKGQKEGAKEQYNSLLKQSKGRMEQSAASRGLGGAWTANQIDQRDAQAPLDLTTIFRGIDQNASNDNLSRLAQALAGNQGLGELGLQGELGRGNLALGQGNLDLGNRQQSLTEANSLYDKNSILPILMQLLGSSYSWQ